MATKYVRETKAGQSISAWVVLKDGRQVATIQAHHSDGGTVTVNVFQPGSPDKPFQHAKAGGYGYDKLTNALAGLEIDGHKLTDHCGGSLPVPEGHKVFPKDFKAPAGYTLANYHSQFITFGFDPEKHLNPHFMGEEGYTSCYRDSGLKYLEALGYTVIQAI